MSFEPFLAYEASAGSGKTFMLVVRYLSLLFMGKDPSKILALTFTNKAANEMLERIINTLETLHHKREGELKEISAVIGKSPDEILQLRDEVLKRFLHSDTKVMTIDKFLAAVLRKFSLHAGIMPTFSTHESQHEIKILIRFLNELFVSVKEDSLINLTLINHAKLSDTIGLLNQLYMLKSRLDTSQYAPQTYLHVKDEILAEVNRLKVLVHTHNDASKTAKNSVDVNSFEAFLKKTWYTKESLNYSTYKKCFVPQMDELLLSIQAKLKQYFYLKEQNYFYELFSLVDIYEKGKLSVAKEDSELGFDDVTALVHKMFSDESLSRDFLYFRLDAEIDHLLLDEFQDTSIVQFEILAPIINEICSGVGVNDEKSLFFVGDVKQSIYRFRGGTKELFYEVASRYNVNVAVLGTNYRSSKSVVEFVNSIFIDKIDAYKPQQIKKYANEGAVSVIENDELLEAAVLHVNHLLSLGVDSNAIAILCATNADGVKIEEALNVQNIDVVTETTSKLINQQAIQALIEYLKYIYFKEEIYARNFFSLINTKPEPIAYVDCKQLNLGAHIKSVIEKYELFNGDLNNISFLETLYNYSDIEALIYEYERIDTTSVRAEEMGVKVLTVHKSKGLEFDHVIVLDRFGAKNSNSGRLIFEYDGVHLQNVFLRQKGRDSLDEAYKNALDKDAKLGLEDRFNALYVAFTRARESLLVIKKSKSSQFDILDLEVMSSGNFHHKEEEVQTNNASKEKAVVVNDIAYTPLNLGRQEELLRGEEEDEQNLHAIDFGLALHYTLEMVNLHNSSTLDATMNSVKNRFGARLEHEDFDAIKQRVLNLLSNTEFQRAIVGECHKEQPIAYNGELRYLDLMVNREDEAIVIDYKSSQLFLEKHLQQISFYKKALKSILNKPVTSYLIYLLEEETKIVEV
ncbi:MAG: RecB-like helicase [Campylobacterota bacterium]|nr:RecB-like helicase [Campylobacterota bacterium]